MLYLPDNDIAARYSVLRDKRRAIRSAISSLRFKKPLRRKWQVNRDVQKA